MTRFEKEISGMLGEFWIRHAEEVIRMVKKASEEATVEEDGAIKWNSNGSYLPDECCEKLEYAGFHFSRQATAEKRKEQNRKFIEEYRKNQAEPTEQELAEMRSFFPEGSKVVDIISGREIQL